VVEQDAAEQRSEDSRNRDGHHLEHEEDESRVVVAIAAEAIRVPTVAIMKRD